MLGEIQTDSIMEKHLKSWRRSNRFNLWLVIASLSLLLVSQVYWLRKVYQDEKENLRNQSEMLLVETVRELQDSIIESHLVVAPDGNFATIKTVQTQGNVLRITTSIPPPNVPGPSTFMVKKDSVVMLNRDTFPSKTSLQMFIQRQNRTRGRLHQYSFRRGIANALQKLPKGSNAYFSLTIDSIPQKTLAHNFKKRLLMAELPSDFEMSRIDSLSNIDTSFAAEIIHFAPASIPSVSFFQTKMTEYRTYLLSQMGWQFGFSLFLIAFTAFTFFLISKSLREQQRLVKLKNDFVSNITHELKTPIATVSVALEALNNFNALQNPERTKEYLDISQHELQRLSILVDRVLKMSMFENDALQLKSEEFDLKPALQNILNSLSLQFEKQKAQVDFKVEGEDFRVQADPVHLTNVVYNLIDNALKYSPGKPKIDIELLSQNGHLSLSVQDQGIGIPSEYQHKIFEQFFRVPNDDRHNVKGYGLGLSYVSSVVEKHGGHILLDSKEGRGTRFTLIFPRKNTVWA